jgi:hypothetical protein
MIAMVERVLYEVQSAAVAIRVTIEAGESICTSRM